MSNEQIFSLLSPKQAYTVKHANRRSNIWEGAIRSSKTVASFFAWALYIDSAPRDGHLVMVGKTFTALCRNVLDPMKDFFGSSFDYSVAKREAYLFGRKIQLVGANDERAEGKIRGMTVSGAYCDEITLLPQNFYNQLMGRMSVRGAKLFGTTNPDNPKHWFKKSYLDRENDIDLISFSFKIDDNPFLDPLYVQQIKNEYTGLWYMRFILGLWVAAEGAVYDFFDESVHLLDPADEPVIAWNDISIDYGTNNPTVFLLWGNNPQTIPCSWVRRCWGYSGRETQKRKTDAQLADDFLRFVEGTPYTCVTVDPSAASFKAELRSRGVIGIRDARNDVLSGIQTVSRMLQSGKYKILDVPENRPLIDEKYSYQWDTKAADRGIDQVIKQDDHYSDAERYKLETDYGLVGTVNYKHLTEY